MSKLGKLDKQFKNIIKQEFYIKMLVETNQLEPEMGFQKGDVHNIPILQNEAIVQFIAKTADGMDPKKSAEDEDLRVDYVQVRREAGVCESRAIVFPGAINAQSDAFVRVCIKVSNKTGDIEEASCGKCTAKLPCTHIIAFLFWLHRKGLEDTTAMVSDFWGRETELLREDESVKAVRIRELIQCDETRLECDVESMAVAEVDENAFFDAVMDEMETIGLRDSPFCRYGRPINDEFEPLFIHHTLLDMPNNFVRDVRSFMLHMEDQVKQGLFDRLAEVSCSNYKSPLWIETQYMRLRCSLIHRIASRRDAFEDDQILSLLFMKKRERSIESRQQLKQHKRFILKQTEKLENKVYHECGILVSECYPYICATPDGITDDHIVEIKAPRTEAEFEQYLEGRETIAPKYMAQIQIQMYVANVTKALYCVLSPTFDTNGALHYVWVQADMEFVASLLGAAEDFWKDVVFPYLASIYFAAREC